MLKLKSEFVLDKFVALWYKGIVGFSSFLKYQSCSQKVTVEGI